MTSDELIAKLVAALEHGLNAVKIYSQHPMTASEIIFKQALALAADHKPNQFVDANKKVTTAEREANFSEVNRYYQIEESNVLNGCEHGYKPATNCPNKNCEHKTAVNSFRALTDQAPEGFVLVPIEPTDEMIDATGNLAIAKFVYKAMIAARPNKGDGQ